MDRDPSRHPDPRPPVDARLVMPETRYELHEGRLVYVAPADEPHGTRHAALAALLQAHAAAEFTVAVAMLTRTSETSDFAPDASVYPSARHPETGGRQLEELAFEIVSTSALSETGLKAARLRERGVRRIFAVDVKRQRALEWSEDLGTWQILGPEAVIEDRALGVALPVAALVGTIGADVAIARAMLARNVPEIAEALAAMRNEGRREGRNEGRDEGALDAKRAALLVALAGRGLAIDAAAREKIAATSDLSMLDAWLGRAALCASVAELLAAG